MSQNFSRYNPQDDNQRQVLEDFCLHHAFTKKIRAAAYPLNFSTDPHFRIFRTLELAQPYLCRTSYFVGLAERFGTPADIESVRQSPPDASNQFLIAMHNLGEATLINSTHSIAVIEERDLQHGEKEPIAYTADELIMFLMDVISQNQNTEAEIGDEHKSEADIVLIPRAYYDALLHIYANKLWSYDANRASGHSTPNMP